MCVTPLFVDRWFLGTHSVFINKQGNDCEAKFVDLGLRNDEFLHTKTTHLYYTHTPSQSVLHVEINFAGTSRGEW